MGKSAELDRAELLLAIEENYLESRFTPHLGNFGLEALDRSLACGQGERFPRSDSFQWSEGCSACLINTRA